MQWTIRLSLYHLEAVLQNLHHSVKVNNCITTYTQWTMEKGTYHLEHCKFIFILLLLFITTFFCLNNILPRCTNLQVIQKYRVTILRVDGVSFQNFQRLNYSQCIHNCSGYLVQILQFNFKEGTIKIWSYFCTLYTRLCSPHKNKMS